MEEQVIQFVEEISESRIMTSNEMLDMRITLLEEMNRSVSPQNSSMFLKSLREKMEASDNSIFTENGLNVEAVKTLVTSVAKEVEKNTSKRIDEELSLESDRNNIEQQLMDDIDNADKDNKDNIKDDDIIDLTETDGINIKMTGAEYKKYQNYVKTVYDEELDGPKSENPQEKAERLHKETITAKVVDEYNKRVKFLIEAGETVEVAKYQALKELNYDYTTPEGKELFDKYTEINAIRDIAIITFEDVKKRIDDGEMIEVTPDLIDSYVDQFIAENPWMAERKSDLRIAIKALFDGISKQNTNDKDRRFVDEKLVDEAKQDPDALCAETTKRARKEIRRRENLEKKARNEYNDAKKAHNDSLNYSSNSQNVVDTESNYIVARRIYMTVCRNLEKTLSENSKTKLIEYNRKEDSRLIIAKDIVERYLNGEKSLCELYNEIDTKILDENNMIFDDVIHVLRDRMLMDPENNTKTSLETIDAEHRLYSEQRELAALEKFMNQNRENNSISRREILKTDKKIENLKFKIESDKKIAKNGKEIFSKTSKCRKDSDSYNKAQENDYVGRIELAKKSRFKLDEYVKFQNSLIEDRNKIKLICKKDGVSEQEAAQLYFKDNPELLNKYSQNFKNLFNDKENESKFKLTIMDDIIKYHNSELTDDLEMQKIKLVKDYDTYIITSSNSDEYINKKLEINEIESYLAKAEYLNRYLNEGKNAYLVKREERINAIVGLYFNSNESALDIYNKCEDVKDIDMNELLKRIAQRADEKNPGSGIEILNLEREYIENFYKKDVNEKHIKCTRGTQADEKLWRSEVEQATTEMNLKKTSINDLKQQYLKNDIQTNEQLENRDELESMLKLRNVGSVDVTRIIKKERVTSQELAEQIGLIIEAGKDEQESVKGDAEDRVF